MVTDGLGFRLQILPKFVTLQIIWSCPVVQRLAVEGTEKYFYFPEERNCFHLLLNQCKNTSYLRLGCALFLKWQLSTLSFCLSFFSLFIFYFILYLPVGI